MKEICLNNILYWLSLFKERWNLYLLQNLNAFWKFLFTSKCRHDCDNSYRQFEKTTREIEVFEMFNLIQDWFRSLTTIYFFQRKFNLTKSIILMFEKCTNFRSNSIKLWLFSHSHYTNLNDRFERFRQILRESDAQVRNLFVVCQCIDAKQWLMKWLIAIALDSLDN